MVALKNFNYRRDPFLIASKPQLDFMAETAPRPMQQHPFYAASMQSLGANVETLIISHGHEDVMSGYALNRQFFKYINVTSVLRGPLWCNEALASDMKIDALKFLRRQFSNWRWRFLNIMPEMADTNDNKRIMRTAGFRRIITGTSTIWIDLNRSEPELLSQLEGNWRNQLNKAKAEKFSLSFGGSKAKHYNWLLEMEKEQQQQKSYHALPLNFVPAYDQAGHMLKYGNQNILSATAIEKGNKIAGALFLLHGNSATYHIGWAGERGRQLNAQNRVLFESMLTLKEHGIRWLELGGIDTGPNAGIARFKLGLGSRPTTLIGSYI